MDRRENLSQKEFLHEYAYPGKPVVLLNAMNQWSAYKLWTKEFFATHYGALKVSVRKSDNYDDEITLRLDEYINNLSSSEKLSFYYLKDWVFEKVCPELMNYYDPPSYFKSWTRWLPEFIRPKWRWLYIAPPNSASHLHVDFLNTSAWNALFLGKKRWLFFSPDQARYMYKGEVNAFKPNIEKFPFFAKTKPLTYLQSAGEIVFTPGGWWHAVRNEEESIAVSENFINEANYRNYFQLRTVIRYFRYADHPFWLA
ncbi:MAG: cupin-like domain-containing protein [Hormoscilla sp. GUM202]|nr:cupin-like domain-containing protein [Hormoscilla sp. GUM202]